MFVDERSLERLRELTIKYHPGSNFWKRWERQEKREEERRRKREQAKQKREEAYLEKEAEAARSFAERCARHDVETDERHPRFDPAKYRDMWDQEMDDFLEDDCCDRKKKRFHSMHVL